MNYMDSMNNSQAQKLESLNERLDRASAPSIAPGTTYKYGFTGGPKPNVDDSPAKRFTNTRPVQPSGATAMTPAGPLPPVDYSQEFFREMPSEPFVPTFANPNFYPGYLDHTHFHRGFGDEMLRMYDTPAREYSNMGLSTPQRPASTQFQGFTGERVNVDTTEAKRFEPYGRVNVDTTQEKMFEPYGPQRSYTIHGQGHFSESVDNGYVAPPTLHVTPQLSHNINTRKPVVKLPVAEATETPDMPQPSDTKVPDIKYDHEICVKIADLAIKTRDHPLDPTVLGEAEAKFHSQADQILNVLSRMDQTIHKFMPDKTIYVRYGLDKVEEKFASLRERIMKQQSLDPREIQRIALHGAYIAPVYELFFVDTEEGLKEMLRTMEPCIVVSDSTRPSEPALSADTEGEISLLQILVHAAKKVYIIDFKKLGGLVFSTSISAAQDQQMSLKTIFESSSILKLFWDARGDSAMFHRFHDVTLRCVLDVQLMDLVTRRDYKGSKGRSKKKLLRDHKTVKDMGQAFHSRCTEIPPQVRQEWVSIKNFGKLAMREGNEVMQRVYDLSEGIYAIAEEILRGERAAAAAASGGSGFDSEGTSTSTSTSTSTAASTSASASTSHSAPVEKPKDFAFPFDIRPLPQVLEKYASNDVTALPVMYDHHTKHTTWNKDVEDHIWLHSEKRLRDAREPGSGEKPKVNENLAPKGWFDVEFSKGLDA